MIILDTNATQQIKFIPREYNADKVVITDEDTNTVYTESSLNGFSDSYTEDKFKEPENKILIVNNKFQTGFDEPLLQTMYVASDSVFIEFVAK